MSEKVCGSCGSDLYLTKNDELWCPSCDGIIPLNKENSLAICNDLINELDNEINAYCEDYSYYYLLEAACQFREIKTKRVNPNFVSWDIYSIIAATLLIKKVLLGHHGEFNKKYFRASLPNLLESILDIVSLKNSKILINEDYGNFFERDDVKNKTDSVQIYSSKYDKYYVFVPKAHWGTFLKNLENEANIARRSKLLKLKEVPYLHYESPKSRKKAKKQINQNMARLVELLYNSFHYIYYDTEMFEFKELDINQETLKFFIALTNLAAQRLPMVRIAIVRIPIDEFYSIARKYDYDSDKLFKMFVSTKDDIKEFPILIAHKRSIILSPETMFLLTGFFDYKLNKKEYDSSISGHHFVHEVETELNKIGFKTDDLKQKGKFLRNRKVKFNINGKNVEREIDLIAYNKSTLLVIECKEWRPRPKILRKLEQNNRVEDIKKEINSKHLDRLSYVKNNYKSYFGFKKNLKVKGIVVTRINEDIDEYKDIMILPKYEITKSKLK